MVTTTVSVSVEVDTAPEEVEFDAVTGDTTADDTDEVDTALELLGWSDALKEKLGPTGGR